MAVSAFEKANRRLIRRLGLPVFLTDGQGQQLAEVKGIFLEPQNEFVVAGKGGNLRMVGRLESLKIMGSDCQGLDKTWLIEIKGKQYYAADRSYDKGHGLTLINLALKQAESIPGSDDNGKGWR